MKTTPPNRFRWMTGAPLVVVLLLLAGCVREIERPENADPRSATIIPGMTDTAAVVPEPSPAGSRSVLLQDSPTPLVGGVISGSLFLKMTNVPKESVVHTGTVSISGLTTRDAVVSVNGVLVDVNGDGRFTGTLSLEQAPNLIEVVASDFQGNKVSAVLTVIYIP